MKAFPVRAGLASAMAAYGLLTIGCDGRGVPSSTPTDPESQELIGGFPAGDPQLDFVGALVGYYPGDIHAQPLPFCSAALVGSESVLTAKHCAQVLNEVRWYGMRAAFALGPNAFAPHRLVDIVDAQNAPGDDWGGFTGVGRDVAVLHLKDPVLDVVPLVVKPLTERNVGQKLVAIGYGVMDNDFTSGERRVGTQTVKATRGRVFEALFGNFDAFFAWFKSTGYFAADGNALGRQLADAANANDGSPVPGPSQDAGGKGGAGGSVPDRDGGVAVEDGGIMTSDAAPFPGDGGFPYPPFDLEAMARNIWDGTLLLEGYEAVTGGAPGDAQPCYGDSGSPLIRFDKKSGRYEGFGVVAGGVGSQRSVCDFGTVYATFGAEVLPFVRQAARWKDPCADADEAGMCRANVATRCTSIEEGPRRLTTLDCDLLGLACQVAPAGVACGNTVLAPPPPPPERPEGTSPPLRELGRGRFSPNLR